MQENSDSRSVKYLSKKIYWFLVPATLVVIFDEWIKSYALSHFPSENTFTESSIVALAVHKNWGLAFDIPFRRSLILLVSFIIGAFLIDMIVKNLHTHKKIAFSCCLILIGAMGNIFDRIYYGFTVDYLIFFGRSALNLCDVLIISGVVLLLLSSQQKKHQKTEHVV